MLCSEGAELRGFLLIGKCNNNQAWFWAKFGDNDAESLAGYFAEFARSSSDYVIGWPGISQELWALL